MEKVTICVGIKNRTYFLVKCLIDSAKNCVHCENLEFSIFDCGSDDVEDLSKVIKENWSGNFHLKRENVNFSRSYSFNRAVENSKTEYVFLCDADMILPKDFLEHFFKNVSNEKSWFPICFSLLKNQPLGIDETKNGWWRDAGYGMVGITKKNFLNLGGLSEKYKIWGGEDNDFYNRLKTKKIRSKCAGLFHSWHCSEYNIRTVPERFRRQLNQLDIHKPKYVLAITTFNRIEYLRNCIQTWLSTRNAYADWTLIVADDGSTDGTLEYLNGLKLLFKKIIIVNKRRGIHHQVNQIIKYLEDKEFDVCFKCDDDVMFLQHGWDDDYFLAIKKYKYDHLVFHDERWIGGKYKGGKHRIKKDTLLSRVDLLNTQGAFYTITPKVIKKVGYFDLNKFGLCGLGHIDYTARCCRAGFNNAATIFDIKDSNKYMKLIIRNYAEAPNEFRHVENTPPLLKIKNQAIADKSRLYIGYNELNRLLKSTKGKVVYILPSNKISGGVAVIIKHANMLRDNGYNVFLLSVSESESPWVVWVENNVPIFSIKSIAKHMLEDIDILIMTFWETVKIARTIKANRKIYFVQSDERKFYDSSEKIKQVQSTYVKGFEYITEAKWIQEWLKKEFGIQAYYVPNGIDQNLFYKTECIEKKTKLRVLLEGALTIPFKGVADAYQAVKDLNCEIWIVSNDGVPPRNWRYNKFFNSVPMSKMREIYSSCDVMLKMSRIEGFFGPPMEAMACGCAVVVGKCTGYDEYIISGHNALVVEQGDIHGATQAVKRLLENVSMRNKLISNGYETVKQWPWKNTLNNLEIVLGGKKQVETNSFNLCEIIIVVHNTLSCLQRCIESIKKYTDYNYSITIVNNNSDYETKSFINNLSDIKVINNTRNFGFGYANNQAIRVSKAKYICFLNSDTVVTKGWLTKMIEVLDKNKNAGLVGPVSNYVSSEIQQVNFPYQYAKDSNDDSKIQSFAKQREIEFSSKVSETNRLIGFCMVTKKEILDKSGIFDDRYEFNFEDDDLGLRIIEQGYKLFCCLDIFVFHFGGQTFKTRFKQTTYNVALEKSKELYVQKWYNTGRIKQIHETHNRPFIIYLLASNSPSGGVKIVFEHANRLKDRGYNICIYCNKNENDSWFDLHAPIQYFIDQSEIPESDIAIGTYFSTLPVLQKIKAKVKIHFCQGYEACLYDKPIYIPLVQTIKDDYRKIREKIVVSKWLKQIVDSEFETDSYYIPNGLDQYVFSFAKHEKNIIPRILIVGNSNLEFKGVRLALQATTNFLKNSRGVIVRLASEKTKLDDKYEFHDMKELSQYEIANVFYTSDVVINAPYKVEGFSLPPLEAMASGTPVISTDCGGVNDYAVNTKNAIIVPSGNSNAIEHALKLVLTNNVLYSRLVDNGLNTAKDFLWHNSIDKLEGHLHRLYQKFISSQKEQLSVCMIVKNEEHCLANCLESIKDLANEIIIVDTGSTDNTIRIAKKFGAIIYHFNWVDNFSAARNFSLKKATQRWTLVLDADEVVSKKDIDKLKQMLRGPEIAYIFTTRNYLKERNAEGLVACNGEYKNEEKDYIGWCRSDKIRLFPTNSKIEFSGHIHELVESSITELGLEKKLCDVPIHHYSKLNKEKNEEYLKLSKKKLESSQSDPKALYELALQYMSLNNHDEALIAWRKLLKLEPENHDVLAHLATTYNLLSDYISAEKFFLKSIEIEPSEYAYKHLGICYAKQEKYEDAYFSFKKVVYNTDDLKTMADFSFCCNILKKYDEGIIVLEKSLKINREETISWGLLEILYNEKGIELVNKNKFLVAARMFKSALSINPNFDIAKANLSALNKLTETKQFSKKFIK